MDLLNAIQVMGADLLSRQVTQFGVAFTLAALVHARQVRKEIALQMTNISESIDNLGKALREDLKAQNIRLINIETRVEKLETKEN